MSAQHDNQFPEITPSQGKFLTTEAIIIGFLLGVSLIVWEVFNYVSNHHVITTPIGETLWVAVYLTMAVAFVNFKLPTPFAKTNPALAMFILAMNCGHVSLFFDSFAVVLLLNSIQITGLPVGRFTPKFNAFAFKVIAAFLALTVGGAFYLGELWGLPYYISSGMDNPTAGLPLMLVVTPYAALVSWIAAKMFPVKLEEVKFDKAQIIGSLEITAALLLVIITHRPILCIGILLVYASVTRRLNHLLEKTLHEIEEGAGSALGLILAALVIQQIPGTQEWLQSHLHGPWIFVLAMISSPFAGAMVPAATNSAEFYENLSWIMVGAPMFVSSSLVAIVVFRDTISNADLPSLLKPFASSKNGGVIHEAVAYTALCVPLTAGLGICLWIGNASGLFVKAYQLLH